MATKVLIIAGGLTHERDVSVRSGRRVANILTQLGYEVLISDVYPSLAEAIEPCTSGHTTSGANVSIASASEGSTSEIKTS